MIRWEILEIVERDGTLIEANLFRPLGETGEDEAAYQLPFTSDNSAKELISAVLFDGFEPIAQSVVMTADGTLQRHWTFKMQVIS